MNYSDPVQWAWPPHHTAAHHARFESPAFLPLPHCFMQHVRFNYWTSPVQAKKCFPLEQMVLKQVQTRCGRWRRA